MRRFAVRLERTTTEYAVVVVEAPDGETAMEAMEETAYVSQDDIEWAPYSGLPDTKAVSAKIFHLN